MVFRCRQCGECCSSMGEVIGIREQTGEWDYCICFSATGEERRVCIDPDKRDLFRAQDILKKRPTACPFLREREDGTVICTVHATRPDLCRQYGCFRILVLGVGGERLGRVVDGSRYFTTMDHELRALWDREIVPLTIADETAWEEKVDRILSAAGYRVVR
ncbi:MAG TPA: YkgJ family cysteine cluster protein [Methanoregula sp.]|nr:YkgJ family cysteine cluster protein [Methanoregula sp.]